MQHIEIGEIKQKISLRHQKYYKVRMLDGRIKAKYYNLRQAKLFVEDNARRIIAQGKINAICIRYTRHNGQASFLMYDSLWGEQLGEVESSEFEESAYDYYHSHYSYFPEWRKAREVNERLYNAADVLRASMVRRPLAVMLTVIVAVLLIMGAATGALFLFNYFNTERVTALKIAFNITVIVNIFASFMIFVISMQTLLRAQRVIHKNKNNLSIVDWKNEFTQHAKRVVRIFYLIALQITVIAFEIILTVVLADFGGNTDSRIYIYVTLITELTAAIVYAGGSVALRFTVYWKITKIVLRLYSAEEAKKFGKWIESNDSIWEFRTNVDFFILPLNHSQQFIDKELQIVDQYIGRETAEEIKENRRKFREYYRLAKADYLKRMRKWTSSKR